MPCPFITERAKEMFQAALEAESNSTFARRARSPSIARLDRFGDVKRLARTAIDTVLRIGKIYMSKERHEENFSDLVGTLLGVLSSISKSAVVAKSSSCPEGLQKIVKEGITDACSKALSKVNDCSNSYYSFQQEESQFFQLSDMVFNISKSVELTDLYIQFHIVESRSFVGSSSGEAVVVPKAQGKDMEVLTLSSSSLNRSNTLNWLYMSQMK